MNDSIRTLLEQGLANGLIGLIGGMARLATGLTPRDSLLAELFRLFVVAMPVAWLSGGLAVEAGYSEYAVRSAAFVSGLTAHNVAKSVMEIGFVNVAKMLMGRK